MSFSIQTVIGRESRAVARSRARRAVLLCAAVVMFTLSLPPGASAQTGRLVVLKVDGLPQRLVDRFVHERNPHTGKSQLPWIDHIFYQRGARLENFYTRGVSLSGPSWAILDTGQHAQIKGNVEFDRYTLHAYDYLNFIPYWLAYAGNVRVDMPGTEIMDEMGTPLLLDAYRYDERYMSFQLYQRGSRWTTLERGLKNRVMTRSPSELVDEWTMGLEFRNILLDQLERELIQKLSDPRVRYLDYYTTELDHRTHHNRDIASQLVAMQELDAIIGRIWSAIQKTPQAEDTAMVLVSDHGTNTDERVYSQGYNLVKLLGSREGGGHHVITKRRLLLDYSIKGFYPLVPLITTTTQDTYYLKGQSTSYPTALLDFDGNERASLHLRDSDLNLMHILLQQLQRKDVADPMRRALTNAFFETQDRRRDGWKAELAELNEELDALRRWIAAQQAIVATQPKKWTKADSDAGRDLDARRISAAASSAQGDLLKYTEYLRTLSNLTSLTPDKFEPSRMKIEDYIAKDGMGDRNSIYGLQNYIVGIAAGGLKLTSTGSLDMNSSFKRVNYFSLLDGVTVRNNVQPEVSNRPIDFVAVRIPRQAIANSVSADLQSDNDPIWLSSGAENEALIFSRRDREGRLSLRYLPVSNLKQDADGQVSFEYAPWRAGLPLKIWEDPQLNLPAIGNRNDWLNQWHSELDWLRVLHRTEYSNGLIGLHEQLTRHVSEGMDVDTSGISSDERLIRRYRRRQRDLVDADLLILANNHWNFDVRGFNPGGNHGSFFRVSTHATLMMAGGARTGIPRGVAVEEPYDGLSFMPTMLALTGQIEDERKPIPVLSKRGFRTFPGRIIKEVLHPATPTPTPIAQETGKTPNDH